MALDTALEIAQRAADELGLTRPSALAGSATALDRQFLAWMNAGGRDIMRAHSWGDLITSYTFPTVASTDTYAVPADFQRLVSETSWDRTSHLPVMGPTTPQMDRYRRDGIAATAAARFIFRQVGKTSISLFPVPTSVVIIGYEYVSRYWARAASVAKVEITVDTDTTIFDPDLMVKDLKWRFQAAKGLDSSITRAERDALLMQLIAADLGGSTLNMGPQLETEGAVVAGAEPNFILGEGGDFVEWD